MTTYAAPLHAATLVHSLPAKSRKGLARDVFVAFATHAGYVYDVTNRDYWAQNGSIHGRGFATFKRQFLTNRKRNRVEN